MMGDEWSPKMDLCVLSYAYFSSTEYRISILAPLLRVFDSLTNPIPTPLTAPLTHAIHALITIPISPSLRSTWFTSTTGVQAAASESLTSASLQSPQPDYGSFTAANSTKINETAVSNADSLPPTPSYLSSPNFDILLRAYDLLEASLNHHIPGTIDPDDPAVRDICQRDGHISLDDTLRPLVLLLTRLCIGDTASRARMRDWLLPANLDRTHPLEARSDTLGRCLRLLGSVYHSKLKDTIGEMLFAVCDSDGMFSTLPAQVIL